MIIKIAIPTDDKLNISACSVNSVFFKVTAFHKENILSEEYRENPLPPGKSETSENNNKIFELISDCDVIITTSVSREFSEYLKSRNKRLQLTTDKIMTNAVQKFIFEFNRMESNTCCCP